MNAHCVIDWMLKSMEILVRNFFFFRTVCEIFLLDVPFWTSGFTDISVLHPIAYSEWKKTRLEAHNKYIQESIHSEAVQVVRSWSTRLQKLYNLCGEPAASFPIKQQSDQQLSKQSDQQLSKQSDQQLSKQSDPAQQDSASLTKITLNKTILINASTNQTIISESASHDVQLNTPSHRLQQASSYTSSELPHMKRRMSLKQLTRSPSPSMSHIAVRQRAASEIFQKTSECSETVASDPRASRLSISSSSSSPSRPSLLGSFFSFKSLSNNKEKKNSGITTPTIEKTFSKRWNIQKTSDIPVYNDKKGHPIDWKMHLISFYAAMGLPEKFSEVDSILARFKGSEEVLVMELCQKYSQSAQEEAVAILEELQEIVQMKGRPSVASSS